MSAETRTRLLAAWDGASRGADRGAIQLNAAAFAGLLLAQSGGSAEAARALVPIVPRDDSEFFARVCSILDLADAE